MKQKICLQAVGIKQYCRFLTFVVGQLPNCSVKYNSKRKYFYDNDLYCYREYILKSGNFDGLKIICRHGRMTVRDKVHLIADVTFEFEARAAKAAAAATTFAEKLLAGKYKFVLEEPLLEARAALLKGTYYLEKLKYYDNRLAATALLCHLPWHLYSISNLWEEMLAKRDDKLAVRQLRVRLRRLRSLLALLKPLLPEKDLAAHRALLKNYADRLSATREYDVALLACAKLQRHRNVNEDSGVFILDALLSKMREEVLSAALTGITLNKITLDLLRLQVFIYAAAAGEKRCEKELQEFFSDRFCGWTDKLLQLHDKYNDMTDMEQLHRIRIKLKRFRYALQAVPEITISASLLRNLKGLQDLLGFLHDAYINGILVDAILRKYPENNVLHYEGAMLKGWEQGKADLALEALPRRWNKFCEVLQGWREENL